VPIGKRRILEARLIGQHKETDSRCLKIDDTIFHPPVGQPAAAACGQLGFAIGSPKVCRIPFHGCGRALARNPTDQAAHLHSNDAPINPQ